MDSKGLRRELEAIKEVLAVKANKAEIGDWENWSEAQLRTCVPIEYQYLEDLNEKALERRKKRLEHDLEDLKRNEDACEFNREVELYRGRDMDDGEN